MYNKSVNVDVNLYVATHLNSPRKSCILQKNGSTITMLYHFWHYYEYKAIYFSVSIFWNRFFKQQKRIRKLGDDFWAHRPCEAQNSLLLFIEHQAWIWIPYNLLRLSFSNLLWEFIFCYFCQIWYHQDFLPSIPSKENYLLQNDGFTLTFTKIY